MAEPTFRLADDGVHFEWSHDCIAHMGGENRPYRSEVTMPHSGGTWRVVQAEPLTVTPSIHCLACGTHGWITNGEWIPA